MYTPEQIEFIKTELKDYLYFFGYTDNPDIPDQENLTPFFKFNHLEKDLTQFGKFREENEKMLARVGQFPIT